MAPEEILAQAGRFLRLALLVGAIYYLVLWLAALWWTFRDARARTESALLQVLAFLLVAVFSFAGLLVYLVLRPQQTLAEAYEESLEQEAMLQEIQASLACPLCKAKAQPDFIFCPWCQTRLKGRCVQCESPLTPRWRFCPFCGQATRSPSAPARSEEELVGPHGRPPVGA